MLRLFGRRYFKGSVAAGTDQVFAGAVLPGGSVLHAVNFDVHLLRTAQLTTAAACMYAVKGFILPILDPDGAATFDSIWDTLVQKDTDSIGVDLDTAAADATPFNEPGESEFAKILDVGLRPKEIYRRERLLTLAKGSVATFQDTETPFAVSWVPGDTFQLRLRSRYRVSQPSIVAFALASPSLDDTSNAVSKATGLGVVAEPELAQLRYLSDVIKRALVHQMFVTEAGAESPWEEATALLKLVLEPDVFEDTGGEWTGVTWELTTKGVIDYSVEGEMNVSSIGTG